MRVRPRLLFDVDGVLTSGFVDGCITHLRELGHDVQADDVDQWDFMAPLGIPQEDVDEVYRRMRLPGVAMSFSPIEGSQEFVRACAEWADVYAVTSPLGGPYWAHDREDWLYKHYGIHRRRVASVRDKFIVTGDALIDDSLDVLANWFDHHPSGLAVLWRIPPNRHDLWSPEASTYDDLRALFSHLKPA